MLLFINTNKTNSMVVPFKKLGDINIIDISFKGNSIIKNNLLEWMTNMLDTFTTEEERFLLIMNDLDDAYENLNNYNDELSSIKKSMFRSLMETFISIGHEIIYFTNKNDTGNPDILELEELEGFEIIRDEIQLHNRLISNIK